MYKDFTQMSVWNNVVDQLVEIYQLTKQFSKDEKYVLNSDNKRSANSVAHNIAEGFGRFEPRDKTRFYKISRGSAYEIISQLIVANRLLFISEFEKSDMIKKYQATIDELDRLIKAVESR